MQKTIFSLPLLLVLLLASCTSKTANYAVEDGFAQGSTYHIVYEIPSSHSTPDSLKNPELFKAYIKEKIALYFEQINKSVSGYDSLSILSKINRGENPQADQIFEDIFNYSKQIYKESGGAVDVSAAPLFNLWGFGFKKGIEITQESVDSLKQFIGLNKVELKDGFIVKEDPRMMLNFNAIAQGYTVDYFCRNFDAMGIENYLVEIGGEVYCKGVNAKGKKWSVGVDKPTDGNFIPGENLQAVVELSGKSLVTSGNYRKFYVKDGVKYSHTIDPVSGYPVQHSMLSATVIAENATIADAYATYFMVVGLERAKEILAATPGMEALLVYGEQENMKQFCTPGLEKMIRK